jgi:hypothetical protein
MKPHVLILAAAVAIGALAALVALSGLHLGSRPSARTVPAPTRTGPRARAVLPSGAPESLLTLAQVERAFAEGYGRFLDGAASRSLRYVSLTAAAQAHADGQIPAEFRDGQLSLASLSTHSSPYSARVTVVLANREQRLPFGVELLREAHGWVVSSLNPPDLTMDHTVTPVGGVRLPVAASSATHRFVTAYARFRAGLGPLPTALATPSALAAIRQNSDGLAGIRLAHRSPRLIGLHFGPLSGGEFAVTATVDFGPADEQFSLLMQQNRKTGVWLCSAFL